MTTYAEPVKNYAFLLSEGNGTISREVVTIVQNATPVTAGTVLGKITSGGKYTPYDDGLTSGAETAVAILAQTIPAADIAAGDVSAQVIFRLAEVKSAELNWHASADATAKTAAVAALLLKNIVVRS